MISIAMTTYNGEKFVKEQINSILNQTYNDFELIVCDDCSKDNTWKILTSLSSIDGRIKIYKNDINLGFKKNFEKAISLCNGDYIAFSDQDDLWEQNHLQVLIDNISHYDIACGNALLVDGDNNSLETLLNEDDGLILFPNDSKKFLYRVLLMHCPLQGASLMMPKEFVQRCLPIPEGVDMHDAWFAANACFNNGIFYTKDVITRYRQHGNNVTEHFVQNKFKKYFKKFVNAISKKRPVRTDRFVYIDELRKKYGDSYKDFNDIYDFLDRRRNHKSILRDIPFIWKNYEFINTNKSKKNIFKQIIIWKMWQGDINE